MLGLTALGQQALGGSPSSGAAYQLVAGAGAFTLTGQNVGLRAARKLAAAAGSFTLSGQSVALKEGHRVAADAGSFTLSGQNVSTLAARRLAVSPLPEAEAVQFGFASLGAVALGQGRDVAAYTFLVAGRYVSLLAARRLTAASGSFTLTGNSVGVYRGYVVASGAGSFTLSGQSVTFRATRRLVASPLPASQSLQFGYAPLGSVAFGQGSVVPQYTFLLTHQNTTRLLASRLLTAAAGSFTLTGYGVELPVYRRRITASSLSGRAMMGRSAAGSQMRGRAAGGDQMRAKTVQW